VTRATAVIVTGASGAIGRALLDAFAAAGDVVVGLDRRAPPSGLGRFVRADLAELCAGERERARIVAALRYQLAGLRLRALVNNAAVQIVKPSGRLAAADWRRTLEVNVVAPALLVKAFAPDLARVHGSVVNVASIHARLTKPGFAAYATSKAALLGLTRSLALDLGGRVRVNAISPAAIDTPLLAQGFGRDRRARQRLARHHPAGRVGTAAELAALAVFLASADAGFITGESFGLDGGIGARLHDPA
jgi:NAD(P)-dependent dehydrogenase (short-subunit alcohol dehydrogenase family)